MGLTRFYKTTVVFKDLIHSRDRGLMSCQLSVPNLSRSS